MLSLKYFKDITFLEYFKDNIFNIKMLSRFIIKRGYSGVRSLIIDNKEKIREFNDRAYCTCIISLFLCGTCSMFKDGYIIIIPFICSTYCNQSKSDLLIKQNESLERILKNEEQKRT